MRNIVLIFMAFAAVAAAEPTTRPSQAPKNNSHVGQRGTRDVPHLNLAAATAPSTAPAADSPFQKVDISKVIKDGKVYLIRDDEVIINGKHIKKMEFGRYSAVIHFANKTNERYKPSFFFTLYDAYGIVVGGFSEDWTFDTIAPGAIYNANDQFGPPNLPDLLVHTTVKLPPDWEVPVYLVVARDEP